MKGSAIGAVAVAALALGGMAGTPAPTYAPPSKSMYSPYNSNHKSKPYQVPISKTEPRPIYQPPEKGPKIASCNVPHKRTSLAVALDADETFSFADLQIAVRFFSEEDMGYVIKSMAEHHTLNRALRYCFLDIDAYNRMINYCRANNLYCKGEPVSFKAKVISPRENKRRRNHRKAEARYWRKEVDVIFPTLDEEDSIDISEDPEAQSYLAGKSPVQLTIGDIKPDLVERLT